MPTFELKLRDRPNRQAEEVQIRENIDNAGCDDKNMDLGTYRTAQTCGVHAENRGTDLNPSIGSVKDSAKDDTRVNHVSEASLHTKEPEIEQRYRQLDAENNDGVDDS